MFVNRYSVDCVCSVCGYKENTGEYEKECPKCQDGYLEEIELECKCGKAYSLSDMERAWENYHMEKENEVAVDDVYKTDLKATGSSARRWQGGSESYDWTEYFACECGESLEYETGE